MLSPFRSVCPLYVTALTIFNQSGDDNYSCLVPSLDGRVLSLSALVLVIFKTLKLSFLRQGEHSYLLILGFSM